MVTSRSQQASLHCQLQSSQTNKFSTRSTKFDRIYRMRTLRSHAKDDHPQRTEFSLADVLELWLNHNRIRYKGATEARYRYLIQRHILPQLGSLPLSCVSAEKINAFLQKKSCQGRIDGCGGLSAAYVRSISLILRSALRFAAGQHICLPLSAPIMDPPKNKAERTILTQEQQQNLSQHLLADMSPTCIGILLSLYRGLRIGEICALSWEDIDLNRQLIRIRRTVTREASGIALGTPKTPASVRDIPLTDELTAILRQAKSVAISPYVASSNQQFVHPRTFEYRFHRVLNCYGLPSVNYHALRHTFATRCVEAGVDVKTLSEILGHANISTTLSTYVHSSIELKRAQMEKLNFYM